MTTKWSGYIATDSSSSSTRTRRWTSVITARVVRARRGEADAELAQRALEACLVSAEMRAQVEAWREAAIDLQRAAVIAESVALERAGDIAALLDVVAARAGSLDAGVLNASPD